MSSLLHAVVAQRLRSILTTALAAQPEPRPAVVTEPDIETPRESFLIDFGPGTWQWPTMRAGARSLATTIAIRVGITTEVPGMSAAGAQARWIALANVVLDALRADPTLQATGAIEGLLGVTGNGETRGPFTSRLPENTGYGCFGDLVINITTRNC